MRDVLNAAATLEGDRADGFSGGDDSVGALQREQRAIEGDAGTVVPAIGGGTGSIDVLEAEFAAGMEGDVRVGIRGGCGHVVHEGAVRAFRTECAVGVNGSGSRSTERACGCCGGTVKAQTAATNDGGGAGVGVLILEKRKTNAQGTAGAKIGQ